jgi:hypothetical protein
VWRKCREDDRRDGRNSVFRCVTDGRNGPRDRAAEASDRDQRCDDDVVWIEASEGAANVEGSCIVVHNL